MVDLTKYKKYNADGGRGLYSTPDTAIKGGEIVDNPISKRFNRISEQNAGSNFYLNLSPKEREELKDLRAGSSGLANIENTELKNELDRQYLKAQVQGKGEKLLNSLLQIGVNEIFYGTLKAFGDIYDAVINTTDHNDFSSDYTRYFEELQDRFRENHPIYQKSDEPGFHFNDFGWFANGLVSVGSTVSLMVPAAGVVKGVGALGKIAKINKLAPWAVKGVRVISAGKLAANEGVAIAKTRAGLESLNMALLSRISENYQEGRETYKLVYDQMKKELSEMTAEDKTRLMIANPEFAGKTDDEIASYLGTEAGNKTYWNDFALLLFDVAQFHAINKLWKGSYRLPLSNDVARAQAASLNKLEGKGINDVYKAGFRERWLSKQGWQARGKQLQEIYRNPLNSLEALELSEGVEEGYQAIMSKEGQLKAKLYLNPDTPQNSIADYLSDKEVWENAFWGVVGGLAFQGAGKGIKRGITALNAKLNKNKLSVEQYNKLLKGADYNRVQNIETRFQILDRAVKNKELLDKGLDYKSPIIDENTGKVTDYEKIEDVNLLYQRQYENFRESVENLVIDAANNGNLSLVREFISNEKFAQYLKQQGIRNEEINTKELNKIVDDTEKVYATAKEDILYNIKDEPNPYIVNIVATQLTRNRLFQRDIQEHIDAINNNLEDKNKIDDDFANDENENYKKQLKNTVNAYIQYLKQQLITQEKEFKDPNNVYSKEAFENDKNIINKQIAALYDYYAQIDNKFASLEELKPLLNKNGILETTENILTAVQAQYDKFIKEQGLQQVEQIDLEVRDLFKSKAYYEVERLLNQTKLPEYNKYFESKDSKRNAYQQYYDNILINFQDIANSKFLKAMQYVTDWLSKQPDLDIALQTLKNDEGRSKKLKDAYDILKFGSQDSIVYDILLNQFVKQERDKRNNRKEENTSPTVEDQKVTPKQEKSINEQVADAINENAKSPSTGEQKEKRFNNEEEKSPVKGDVKEDYVPGEDESDVTEQPIEEAIAKKEIEEEEEYTRSLNNISNRKDGVRKAVDVIIEKISNDKDLIRRLINSGIGSKEYNDFVTSITEELEIKYNSNIPLEGLAEDGLCVILTNIKNRDNRNKNVFTSKNDKEAFDKLYNALFSIISGKTYNEESNALFESINEEQLKEKAKTLFLSYVELNNISPVNGKYEIDVKTVFSFLTSLVGTTDLDYQQILLYYDDFRESIDLLKDDKEFNFTNTSLLGKNRNQFLDYLYDIKTDFETKDSYMHTAATNFVKNTQELADLIDNNINGKVYFRQSNKGDSISINVADSKGNLKEISFLSKVHQVFDELGETNTGFASKYFTVEVDSNGNYSHTYDELIYDLLGENEFLYNWFKNKFITEDVTGRYNISDDKNYSYKFITNTSNIIKLLETDSVKSYLFNFGYGSKIYDGNGNVKNKQAILAKKYIPLKEVETGFNTIFDGVINTVFYELNSMKSTAVSIMDNKQEMIKSYERWKANFFDNYSKTFEIQNRIEAGEEVIGYLRGDSARIIGIQPETDIKNIEFDLTKHKKGGRFDLQLVYSNGSVITGEDGKSHRNDVGYGLGTVAIRVGETLNNAKDGQQTGGYYALLTSANTVKGNNDKLVENTKKYLQEAISNYYKSIRSKDSSVSTKNAAYQTLLNTFKDLFGNTKTKPFNYFYVVDGKTNFSIAHKDDEGNYKIIGTFYKYNNKVRIDNDRGVYYDRTNNDILSDLELNDNLTAALVFTNNDKRYVIKNIGNKANKLIDIFLDKLTSEMTFNDSKFAIVYNNEENVEGKHISKEDGKIVIKIGDYREEYDNYAEFIIKNNAFKTTYTGKGSSMERKGKIKAVFIEYGDETTPITKEELEAEKNKNKNINKTINKLIKDTSNDGQEVDVNEFLNELSISELPIGNVLKFNDELKATNSSNLGILPSKFIIRRQGKRGNKEVASYNPKDKNVYVTLKGLNHIKEKHFRAVTYLMHENVHKLINEQAFFEGKEGQLRQRDIINTFDIFYQNVKDRTDEVGSFARKFYKEYYNGDKNTLAQEWLAEAVSNYGLMQELNNIDSGETIEINGEQKPQTLLGKIIKFIADLFYKIANINDNSLLANIYDIIEKEYSNESPSSSEIELTLFDKDGNPYIIEEEVKGTDETEDLKNDSDESYDDNVDSDGNPIDRQTFNPNLFENDAKFESIREDNLGEQAILDDYDKDEKNNPYGLSMVSDMNEYLKRYNPLERRLAAQGIAKNELLYTCR